MVFVELVFVLFNNPSLQLIENTSFSPTASSQITNLDSDQVTPPWTCCFDSPNNGWRPSMSDMIRAISLDISRAFNTIWHPALLSKLSNYGIQWHFHTWLTDVLHSHSQCEALDRILFPISMKAREPQGTLWKILFPIFINDLSDSLGIFNG